jgi:hypothetical protein
VGHMYMCQVEPWLDATGWGVTWPSLEDRNPDPVHEPPPPEGNNARPAAPAHSHQQSNEGDEDSGEDTDMGGLEDDDGDDPEQPEENEDGDSDEDMNNSRNQNRRMYPRDGEGGGRGMRAMMSLRDTTCSLQTWSLTGTVCLVSIAKIELQQSTTQHVIHSTLSLNRVREGLNG